MPKITKDGSKEVWTFREYIGDVIKENLEAQKHPEKMGEGARGRKIASIPTSVFRSWQREFEQTGAKQQDRWVPDWRIFLRKKIDEHPQFRTVDKMLHVSPYMGNTIIK